MPSIRGVLDEVSASVTATIGRRRPQPAEALLQGLREAILTLDTRQRILAVNPVAESLLRCTSEVAVGQGLGLGRFLPLAQQPGWLMSALEEPALRPAQGIRMDGDVFEAEISLSRLPPGPRRQQRFALVLREPGPHRLQPRTLDTQNRLFSALGGVRAAMSAAATRDGMFAQVCRALVQQGGLRMAWIGWHPSNSRRIEPVASHGDGGGYVDGVRVYADDRLEGRGPCGRAFRDGRPYVCNDILQDPATLAFRERATAHGLRSCAAFPLLLKDRVCGVLNVFAGEAGWFHDIEENLLLQAAGDISFALENFARDEERNRALEESRREQVFSATMVEGLPGIFYFYDEQGRFLRWNRNFERVSGYSAGEIAKMHPLDFFAGDDRPLLAQRIAHVFDQGQASVEADFLSRDGRRTPYLFTGQRVVFDGTVCLLGMGIDLTDRMRAETALRELNASLQNASGPAGNGPG